MQQKQNPPRHHCFVEAPEILDTDRTKVLAGYPCLLFIYLFIIIIIILLFWLVNP